MQVFETESADDTWVAAAGGLLRGEQFGRQESRGGLTRELLHVALVVRDPRQRWVLSRHPAPNPAFAIAETLWILAGRDDSALPNFWNPALPRFQGRHERYHGAYGHRLRHAFGIDQLDRAYQALASDPASRQVVVEIYHPARDLPSVDGSPQSEDIPCSVCGVLKIRGGRLEWLQVVRSNDLIRGLPYNFVQFTMLQEVIAGWLGAEVGTYTQISDSLHIYERDVAEFTITKVPAAPKSEDRLGLPRPESDAVLAELLEAAEVLRDPDASQEDFDRILDGRARPTAYQNLLAILGADAARRRQWSALTATALRMCSNPLLRMACALWFEHRNNGQVRELANSC